MNKEIYVGLDVHADTIAAALAESGRGGEVRFFGTIRHFGDSVLRLTKKLTEKASVRTSVTEAFLSMVLWRARFATASIQRRASAWAITHQQRSSKQS